MTHWTVASCSNKQKTPCADGVTALILASRQGHIAAVDVLTQLGADVNIQDNCK